MRDNPHVGLQASVALVFWICTQLLPPLPQYLGAASSMAAGEAVSNGIVLLLALILEIIYSRVGARNRPALIRPEFFVLLVGLAATVILHAVVANFIHPVNSDRLFASLALLMLSLLSASAFARVVWLTSDTGLDSVIRASFSILWLILLLRVSGLQPNTAGYEKSTFPFTETSHFALAFCPVLMYVTVTAKGANQLIWLAISFMTAVLLKSMALLAGSFLIAACVGRLMVIGLPILAILAVALPLELQYFSARLDFSDSTSNISVLVYLQGWQQLLESLRATSLWGLGFQQMGEYYWQLPETDLISAMSGGVALNLSDGSFVMSKLGSEFGVFGLIAVAAYVIFAVRCIAHLKAGLGGVATKFSQCIVVSFAVDVFFRGTGYFTQSTHLFLVALCFWS